MSIIENNNNAKPLDAKALQLARFIEARTMNGEAKRMHTLLVTWLEASDKRSDAALRSVASLGARTLGKVGGKRTIIAETAGDLRNYVESIRQRAMALSVKVDEKDLLTFARGTSAANYVKGAIRFCDAFIAEYKQHKEDKSNADKARDAAKALEAKAA